MKNLQQNLLILLALGLCGLCVYQWYGQTLQRRDIQKLEQMVFEGASAIQGYTNSIRTMDRQIAQMDARITELKSEAKTNATLAASQREDINRLTALTGGLTNQVTAYKSAVASLEGKLKDAYDGIQKQNDAMKDLVAQRDDFVKKYNDSIKDRNDVVNKYNDLVKRVEESQAKK